MILAAIRKLITGVDPVELNARLTNVENGSAYAREVAHGAQAEIVHARGDQANLKAALTTKATAADATLLHMRVDEVVAEIHRCRAELETLAKPPVASDKPGITVVNGRQIDAAGKLVEDLPAVKTGEPTLRERLDGLDQVPVKLDGMVAATGLSTVEAKVTKPRKPRKPKDDQ